MNESRGAPPALPPEAVGRSLLPPREYVAKDADGSNVRMVPVWKELQRITAGYQSPDLERRLGLEAGSIEKFSSPPNGASFEEMLTSLPPARIIHPLFDFLGLERPPLIAEICAGDTPVLDGDQLLCSHIGTLRAKEVEKQTKIEWKDGEFHITLPVQDGLVEAKVRPSVISVVRIRELGAEEWSPGFETPLTGCRFVGLKPDTEYEIRLTHRNKHGEGPPVIKRLRTSREQGG